MGHTCEDSPHHRILHSGVVFPESRGILQQLRWENESAKELKIPWTSEPFAVSRWLPDSQRNPVSRVMALIASRIAYYRWLFRLQQEFDVFILRYSPFDPMQLAFLLFFRRPVAFVHHVKESEEIRLRARRGWKFLQSLDQYLGWLSYRFAHSCIAVTREILDYETKRFGVDLDKGYVYPNGGSPHMDPVADERGSTPHVVAVASSWSRQSLGLDLILKALNSSKEQFVLDIVGSVPPQIVAAQKTDSRVVFHGPLDYPELARVYQEAWIGLAGMGWHRLHMETSRSLKVRDYLTHGIPVYASSRDVFPTDFPFYVLGEVAFDTILEKAREFRSFTRLEVATAAHPFVSKTALLDTLYRQISATVPPPRVRPNR